MSNAQGGDSVLNFHHICIEVDDLQQSAEAIAKTLGGGPFFLMEHAAFDEIEYVGGPAKWDHSLAFGYVGTLLVELHLTHSVEPAELGKLVGNRPISHTAYLVDDIFAESDRLASQGSPRLFFGRNGAVRLVYHETPTGLIELLNGGEFFTSFSDAVAAQAASWDGTEPLRPVSALGLG
jgi:catechol 2,3-dioxygenase-like lactoylglutathione lyase family enzyme